MAAPNDIELELIEQLRGNLIDLELCEEALSDINLVRWIRARNHVLKDAEAMFRDYVKWFDEMKLESIFDQEIPDVVLQAFPQPICGLDFDGSPIILGVFRDTDLPKLIKAGYKKQLQLCLIQYHERNSYLARRMIAERPKNEKRSIQFSSIMDCEGLSWSHFASADAVYLMIENTKTIEMRYPEALNKTIVINAPRIFTLAWAIVKPFISPKTMEKIQIYGPDRQQWQEAIYKMAPKESLPKKYGGILPDDVDILPKCHECVPKKRGCQ